MNVKPEAVTELNYLVRSYEGLTKLIAATLTRLQSKGLTKEEAGKDPFLKGEHIIKSSQTTQYKGLNSVKTQLTSRIEKELQWWPIWSEWMVNIPGIGPAIASQLIMLYYYRFIPVCTDCKGNLIKKAVADKKTGKEINTLFCEVCQKSVKGEGNLQHRIELKDFPRISSWWHYLGRHVVDGEMPKRRKGVQVDWSTKGRTVGYQISEQFNRPPKTCPYRIFLLRQKGKHLKKNDTREKPWTKVHIHNAARNEVAKLFLSHFWQVARELDGLPVTEPYVGKHLGHDIIPPYYWNEKLEKAA